MINFFLMTRGRTGSTAVTDELNRLPQLDVSQEVFSSYDFENNPGAVEIYKLIPPFDIWTGDRLPNRGSDAALIDSYLDDAKSRAQEKGAKVFGFKLLSEHLDDREHLHDCLLRQGFKAVYLTRSIPRQILSGIVARERGVYNTTGDVDDSFVVEIDLKEFDFLVRCELEAIDKELKLVRGGFDSLVISYEDFIADRRAFYSRLLGFLGTEVTLPEATDYKVMIRDITETVSNYDAVVARAREMGQPL